MNQSQETVTYSLETILTRMEGKIDSLQKDVTDLKVGQAVLTGKVEGIENLGFVEVRQKGSHKQFCPEDGRATTVPFHKGRDIAPRLLRQIASDINLTVEEFLESR